MNWKQNVWPDSLKADVVYFSENNSSFAALSSPSLRCYHSFALGFFGFHYIRAAKENDLILERESLKIFHKLIIICDLEEVPLGIQRNGRLFDFWKNVIKKAALSLGDSLGQEAQQMVELGFWLAAVHAGLVQAQREDDQFYMKKFLGILEDGLIPFQYSDIPLPIKNSLIDIKKLLTHSKKPAIVCKCFDKIKALLKQLLVLGIPQHYQEMY